MDNSAAVPEDPSRRKSAYALITIGCITLLALWLIGFSYSVLFVGLALLFLAEEWSQLSDNWWTIKAPTIVLLLLPGVLFLLNWYHPKPITRATS